MYKCFEFLNHNIAVIIRNIMFVIKKLFLVISLNNDNISNDTIICENAISIKKINPKLFLNSYFLSDIDNIKYDESKTENIEIKNIIYLINIQSP